MDLVDKAKSKTEKAQKLFRVKTNAKKDDKSGLGEFTITPKSGFAKPEAKWHSLTGKDANGQQVTGEVLVQWQLFEPVISGPTAVVVKSKTEIIDMLWTNPEYKDLLVQSGFKQETLQNNPALARKVTSAFLEVVAMQAAPAPAAPTPPPPPPPPPPGGATVSVPAPPAMNSGPPVASLADLLAKKKDNLNKAETAGESGGSSTGLVGSWQDEVKNKLITIRAATSEEEESDDWDD